jgi:ribonucleotide monophosphatase NagD (HAD superfamily)
MNNFLQNIKLFVLDLDGVLYIGNKIVPEAIELVSYLRKYYKIAFFSNTSGKTSLQICEKLNRLGFICTKMKCLLLPRQQLFI